MIPIIIIILLIAIGVLFFWVSNVAKVVKFLPNVKETYSFAEAINLADLPILIMSNNGKKLRFILDSGSNGCHIDKSILDTLSVEKNEIVEKTSNIATGAGIIASSNEKCTLKLKLNNTIFEVPFAVEDLSGPFNFIKEEDGIQVHGILGNNFLEANGWVLDFADNIAYMKK